MKFKALGYTVRISIRKEKFRYSNEPLIEYVDEHGIRLLETIKFKNYEKRKH